MKCKCKTTLIPEVAVQGLIEAYWNVNNYLDTILKPQLAGLIEAYWNVNFILYIDYITQVQGLIEAYWNVNVLRHRQL